MSVEPSITMLTNSVAPDKLGGLERYVRELATHLVIAGRDVTIVSKQTAPEQPRTETATDGVKIVRYVPPDKKDPLFSVKYPAVVAKATRSSLRGEGDAALLHAHFFVPALVPLLARRPYVYTFHAPVYRELLQERHDSYALPRAAEKVAVAGVRLVERRVVRGAATVIALSEFARQEIALLDAAAAAAARIIPGGVDTERFSPGPTGASLTFGSGPLLVSARRFTPRTGVAQLVEAMSTVRRHMPEVRLVALGEGPSWQAVREQVTSQGLDGTVTLPGRVTDEELVDWYRRADLVVMPTQELEGFGLTSAEALSCGTPVLATPVGANPELLRALPGPMLTEGIAPQQLAHGVLAAISSLNREPLSPAGIRQSVEPRLGWGRVVEQHLEVYAQMREQGTLKRSPQAGLPKIRYADPRTLSRELKEK